MREIGNWERWEGTGKSNKLVMHAMQEARMIELQGCGLEYFEQ